MSMCLWSLNSLHSILASVLSKTIKQYCLKFHAPGQHWTGTMQTRWQRPYNVLYERIARARLESVTQSACVAYLLLPAKPWWWHVSLDDRDSSKIFKREKFAQLTMWYGNDINMTKSHFNLLQISIQYTYGPISLWQTSYSKRK